MALPSSHLRALWRTLRHVEERGYPNDGPAKVIAILAVSLISKGRGAEMVPVPPAGVTAREACEALGLDWWLGRPRNRP